MVNIPAKTSWNWPGGDDKTKCWAIWSFSSSGSSSDILFYNLKTDITVKIAIIYCDLFEEWRGYKIYWWK